MLHTISGKRYRHLSIIALPLSASVGLITSIATASTSRVTSTAASSSASMTASILGEFGLGLINLILVDRLGAFGDTMIGITAIQINVSVEYSTHLIHSMNLIDHWPPCTVS
jgi:hypothetical protein